MNKWRATHRINVQGNATVCCFILSVLLLSAIRLHAQIDTASYWNTLPKPAWGWNSLFRRIHFPELAERAGLRGAFLATVTVDSCGGVTTVSVTGFDGKPSSEIAPQIFVEPIIEPLKTVRWIPGTEKGKSSTSSVTVPIIFASRSYTMGPATLITAINGQINRHAKVSDWLWYRSPAGGCGAMINQSELKITPSPQHYCDTSFSSDDPERSYEIRQAQWTRNSIYFVFSLTGSENHELPILVDVFSTKTNRVYSLEAIVGPVASSRFRILGHDSVQVTLKPALGCVDSTATFSLGDLIPSQ